MPRVSTREVMKVEFVNPHISRTLKSLRTTKSNLEIDIGRIENKKENGEIEETKADKMIEEKKGVIQQVEDYIFKYDPKNSSVIRHS